MPESTKSFLFPDINVWVALTYDGWLEDARISFLEEPPGLERLFRELTRLQRPAPKDRAHSYLSAFAAASQLRLVTFDRALSRKGRHSVLLKPTV